MKKLLVLLLLLPVLSSAQIDEATKLFTQGNYEEARKIYEVLVEANPEDSSLNFAMARNALASHDWSDVDRFLTRAAETNYSPAEISFYRAQYALMAFNNTESAMDHLSRGAEAGMQHFIPLIKDTLFQPLHALVGWQDMLNKVEKNTYPCKSNEKYRQFDFWLGEWEVYVNEVKIGENSITLANGGCAIHEYYTTYPRDYTGESINFYDPMDQRWHQHWVGSAGDVINFVETNKGAGLLEFTGTTLGPSGIKAVNRMTFTAQPNGSVRQLIESSTDAKQTWTIVFDGLYRKQNDTNN